MVLSHGFTGTPASMRPWAEHLAAAGYTVRLPLLPGHGATWQETTHPLAAVVRARSSRPTTSWPRRCDTVFAAGLSMGGTLVTRLAEEQPATGDRRPGAGQPRLGTMRRDAEAGPLRHLGGALPARRIGGDIKKPGVAEPAYDRTPVVGVRVAAAAVEG